MDFLAVNKRMHDGHMQIIKITASPDWQKMAFTYKMQKPQKGNAEKKEQTFLWWKSIWDLGH